MNLTGQHRYRQACLKATILGRISMKKWLSGEIPYLPSNDPTPFLIKELERAYEAGIEDGKASKP